MEELRARNPLITLTKEGNNGNESESRGKWSKGILEPEVYRMDKVLILCLNL